MKIKKYFKIWLITTLVASQIAFASRLGAILFTIAKLLRFGLFLFFLILLLSKTRTIAGYSLWQVILFFITFNIVDTGSQFLLRETYRFRTYVVKGYLDYILIKPVSPLFRSLFGGSDILDAPILVLLTVFLIIALSQLGPVSFLSILLYLVFILNAFVIAVSFHILVLAIGILTTEVDNSIMLYRDLTQMGRVPVDIYGEPLRGILTFVIPVGVMMTFPAKVLMGLLSIQTVVIALLVGLVIFYTSFKFWQFAIRRYSSASS